MKKCERCGKKYERSEDEIIAYPNLCKECDIILSKDLEEGFEVLKFKRIRG